MRFKPTDPPRTFEVGMGTPVQMTDCAHIELEPDEQVTFLTPAGAEYDVARKSFGYYATPSLNGRLAGFDLRAVLVRNRRRRYFIMLVERGKESLFHAYVENEQLHVIIWMDSDEALRNLERSVQRDRSVVDG